MKFIKVFSFHNFLSLLKTILSLIKIFFKININKEKVIFFYFLEKKFYKKIFEKKKTLKKKKNLSLFFLFNSSSQEVIQKYKDSYFLDINYLRYIPMSNLVFDKVSLFISSYVNYVYPKNSKNTGL